jgi:Uma2 family endonuclease
LPLFVFEKGIFEKVKVEEPIVSYGMLDESREYTYAEYLTWKFKERVELIHGRIRKMSPAPSWKHQNIGTNTYDELKLFFKVNKCKVLVSPLDVCLAVPSKKKNTTVIQPDVCVLCDLTKLDDHGIVGTPDLIVEILSPGNIKHDLDTKFELYQEASLPEYWIVNPMERNIIVYTLRDGAFSGSKIFTEGENAVSKHFKGLEVSVEKVFEGV